VFKRWQQVQGSAAGGAAGVAGRRRWVAAPAAAGGSGGGQGHLVSAVESASGAQASFKARLYAAHAAADRTLPAASLDPCFTRSMWRRRASSDEISSLDMLQVSPARTAHCRH
jgi:hypothetical protein